MKSFGTGSGPLPWEADNLLYLVGLKLLAWGAGVESINQSGATITLTLLEPVGGARLALERALGPLATVGNQQVRVSVRRTDPRWTEGLLRVLEAAGDLQGAGGVGSGPSLRSYPAT